MAILKFGSLVVGARGTIGGIVYTNGRGGPYAKIRANIPNPRTNAQSRDRLRISLMPGYWRALTPTQRDDWADWAALPAQAKINSLGESYNPSGWQWFVTINVRLLKAGLSPRQDPPTTSTPAMPVIDVFTFEEVAGSPLVEIEYDPAEFPTGTGIVIEAWSGIGTRRRVQYSTYYQLINGIASPTGAYDFTTNFEAQFGPPVEGQQAFLRIYKQDDEGMRSGPTTMSAIYSL